MANLTADRVKETTTTTGTGTITLAGAVAQYRTFASAFADGSVVQYAIIGQTGTEWEVGNGTFTASGTTLARTTVLASSNANAAVNFSAGTKDVFATANAAELLTHVVGPASATDNAVAVYDGTTGKLQKNSPVVVAAGTGDVSGLTKLDIDNLRLDGNTMSSASGSIYFFANGGVTNSLTIGPSGISWNFALSGPGNAALGGYAHQLYARTQGSGAPLDMPVAASSQWATNEGATAEVYINLPAAEAGLHFTACVQDADGFRFTAAAGDTIRVLDKVTAAGGYISSTTIGSCVTLVAINATEWFATSINGTWTDGTFTFDNTGLTTP